MNDSIELDNSMMKVTDDKEEVIDLTEVVDDVPEKGQDDDSKIIDPTLTAQDDGIVQGDSADESFRDKLSLDDNNVVTDDNPAIDEANLPDISPKITDYDPEDLSLNGAETTFNINNSGQSLPHNTTEYKSESEKTVPVPEFTDQQLENALAKVIREEFSHKIEPILFQVVEKIVAEEIANIKKKLNE